MIALLNGAATIALVHRRHNAVYSKKKGESMPALTELLDGIQCPRCGHENTYAIREVEEVLSIDGNSVAVRITVGECSYCGEHLLDRQATHKLEDAAEKLRAGATADLIHTGEAYRYP